MNRQSKIGDGGGPWCTPKFEVSNDRRDNLIKGRLAIVVYLAFVSLSLWKYVEVPPKTYI